MLSSKHKFIRTISAGIYSLPHYDVNLLNCLFLKRRRREIKGDMITILFAKTRWSPLHGQSCWRCRGRRGHRRAGRKTPRRPEWPGPLQPGPAGQPALGSLRPQRTSPLKCVSPGSKETEAVGLAWNGLCKANGRVGLLDLARHTGCRCGVRLRGL